MKSRTSTFEKIVLKLTHRIWNKQISRLLRTAYHERIIDSKKMHILASWFDPTQSHRVSC